MRQIIQQGKQGFQLTILIITILFLWSPGAGAADGLPEILPIQPVPNIKQPEFVKQDSTAKVVIRQGLIERIEDGAMVISDRIRRLSPSVKYLSKYANIGASPSKFQVGSFVGFKINAQREISEIWLIEDEEE